MGWAIIFLLVLAAGAGMIWLGKLPRLTWELLGSALLLGVAGYAWQGNPGLPGAPRDAKAMVAPFDEDMAAQRRSLGERYGKAAQWLTMSDGMARQGDTENAANVLVSALKAEPGNADLWVGMGNALVTHAGGVLSPSADYSYRQALRLSPQSYSAPYFYGLMLARGGQLEEARKLWAPLAARLPEKSELRRQLERDLAEIDRLLQQQGQQ